MTRILAEHTGQDASVVEKDTERDRFMSAAEAVEYGIVDRIISRHERPSSGSQEGQS